MKYIKFGPKMIKQETKGKFIKNWSLKVTLSCLEGLRKRLFITFSQFITI